VSSILKNKMKNIILIGMCGAGKTTLAKEIAKKIRYNHIDADDEIEKNEGETFQDFIDKYGEEEAIKIEERGILNLAEFKDSVIATGGSVVYSVKAMRALKKNGILVYISLPIEIIEKRLCNDKDTRGIIGFRTRSLKELFKERKPLYEKYADITINLNGGEKVGEIVAMVIEKITLCKQ